MASIRTKVTLARLAFAADNFPDYSRRPVEQALKNGGRFSDPVDKVLFVVGMRNLADEDARQADGRGIHRLSIKLTRPELRTLGAYAAHGYVSARELFYEAHDRLQDDFTAALREEIESHPHPEELPAIDALRLVVSDDPRMKQLRDEIVQGNESENLMDMMTTAGIVIAVRNYFSQ